MHRKKIVTWNYRPWNKVLCIVPVCRRVTNSVRWLCWSPFCLGRMIAVFGSQRRHFRKFAIRRPSVSVLPTADSIQIISTHHVMTLRSFTCSAYPSVQSGLGPGTDLTKFMQRLLRGPKNGSSAGISMGKQRGCLWAAAFGSPLSVQHSIPLPLANQMNEFVKKIPEKKCLATKSTDGWWKRASNWNRDRRTERMSWSSGTNRCWVCPSPELNSS